MDLALIWAFLIALAVMLYVILDGFDLGIGILTAFAQSDHDRNMMTATIEPVWDGNETWLILGGGGLFAAFPLAYAVLMPALYIPVLIMLAALIFRGVAFEFRHKAVRAMTQKFWNGAFAYGSLFAALSQGLILGGFIQGVTVEGRNFAGGPFDWLTPFSLLVAVSLVMGYVLLGACWLYLKTEQDLQHFAKKWARQGLIGVALAIAAISIATLSIDPRVTERWGVSMSFVQWGKFLPLLPIPIVTFGLVAALWRDLSVKSITQEWRPFLLAVAIFLTGYLGLAVSLFPYLVPFEFSLWDAAGRDNALGFMLIGASVMIPVILLYTFFVYRVFWGKVSAEDGYHD